MNPYLVLLVVGLILAVAIYLENYAPIDALVSDWSEWSDCSQSCGEGTKTRTRRILKNARNGGKQFRDKLSESASCNLKPCPAEDCEFHWTESSPCSETCGGGITCKSLIITKPAAYGGKCPAYNECVPCNTQHCKEDGYIDLFSDVNQKGTSTRLIISKSETQQPPVKVYDGKSQSWTIKSFRLKMPVMMDKRDWKIMLQFQGLCINSDDDGWILVNVAQIVVPKGSTKSNGTVCDLKYGCSDTRSIIEANTDIWHGDAHAADSMKQQIANYANSDGYLHIRSPFTWPDTCTLRMDGAYY